MQPMRLLLLMEYHFKADLLKSVAIHDLGVRLVVLYFHSLPVCAFHRRCISEGCIDAGCSADDITASII